MNNSIIFNLILQLKFCKNDYFVVFGFSDDKLLIALKK